MVGKYKNSFWKKIPNINPSLVMGKEPVLTL